MSRQHLSSLPNPGESWRKHRSPSPSKRRKLVVELHMGLCQQGSLGSLGALYVLPHDFSCVSQSMAISKPGRPDSPLLKVKPTLGFEVPAALSLGNHAKPPSISISL